jgi:hypothetical protein
MEALCSSRTTVNVCRTTQRYNPTGITLCPESLCQFDHLFACYKYVPSNGSYYTLLTKSITKQIVVVVEMFVRSVRKMLQTDKARRRSTNLTGNQNQHQKKPQKNVTNLLKTFQTLNRILMGKPLDKSYLWKLQWDVRTILRLLSLKHF